MPRLFLESKATSLAATQDPLRQRNLALADWLEAGFKRTPDAERSRWVARVVKALRTCGRPQRPSKSGRSRPAELPCNLKICAMCRMKWRKREFAKFRQRAVTVMGEAGGALFITLTAGPQAGSLAARIQAIKTAIRSLGTLRIWTCKKRGLVVRVGVVWGFEIEPGAHGVGHPHLHLVAFAPDLADLDEYREALLAHWRSCFPDAAESAQKAEPLGRDAASWAPRLHYVLKGSEVAADWPEPVLDAALLELTSGRHHHGVLGLMKLPRRKREAAVAEIRELPGAVGNSEEATS